MHLYKNKKRIPALGIIVMTVIFIVALTYFYGQINNMQEDIKTSEVEMLSDAIEKAVVTCYSIEGCYPESIQYIEEHYGVVIDREKYFVDYQTAFANMKPQVAVYTISTHK